MKLYLLSRKGNIDYDTYYSCVVCAENEDDAKTIHPSGDVFKENEPYCSWVKKTSSIVCEEIGEANVSQKRGVIIASFNAG